MSSWSVKRILYLSLLLSIIGFPLKVHASYLTGYADNFCLSFDGAGDYVSCGISNVYEQSNFTIELWISPRYTIQPGSSSDYGHQYGRLVSYDLMGGWYTEFNYITGQLQFWLLGSDGLGHTITTIRNVWLNDSWYHIAVTYAHPNLDVYINASIDFQTLYNFNIQYSDGADLRISSSAPSMSYAGLIDEIRYWKVGLTSNQIKNSWTRVLSEAEMTSADLIGYWRFDEGQGDTARDYSNQNNTANLAAAPSNPTWIGGGAPMIAEFPTMIGIPILTITTLLAIIAYKRRHRSSVKLEKSL